MSSFERYAVARLIEQARGAGVAVPDTILCMIDRKGPYPAREWARLHPDDETAGCCYGSAMDGQDACTCWVAVYDVEQTEPRKPTGLGDIAPRPSMCADCAFRPGSPERGDTFTREALLELPLRGDPFWCHEGMRRPARWEHPDGRVMAGSPDDWHPARIGSVPIPYRADGSPALLCAGWAALAAHAKEPTS